MKRLLLLIIALSCALAVSSCCDQSYCPENIECDKKGRKVEEKASCPLPSYEKEKSCQEKERPQRRPAW